MVVAAAWAARWYAAGWQVRGWGPLVSVIRDRGTAPDLHKFWQIAEETAAEHGHTVHREDWRMAVAVFLADSRKEAMAQARVGAGRYQREYFEETMGLPAVIDGPPDKIIDEMVARGAWCVGTPDDLIAHIKRLDEQSGGFGGLLIQATERVHGNKCYTAMSSSPAM